MTNARPQAGLREVSCCHEYLSEQSPQDKPWDKNKLLSERLANLYDGTIFNQIAGRMRGCSRQLEFGWIDSSSEGETARLRLKTALFCRCRHCAICQWRRSMRWTARFLQAFPAILADYPKARFIFLTLTVPNCPVDELRDRLGWMNKSWQRMSQRKNFPAIGFARSTEVTRNHADNTAHPHFHALLMVDPGYFAGHSYLSQADWTELWRSCLKYPPDAPLIVNVKAVKPNKRWLTENPDATAETKLASAVVETFKYTTKPGDLLGNETAEDQQWLLQITKQLQGTRSVALGGVFKNYLSDSEPEDLIGSDDTEKVSASSVFYLWSREILHYIKSWED